MNEIDKALEELDSLYTVREGTPEAPLFREEEIDYHLDNVFEGLTSEEPPARK